MKLLEYLYLNDLTITEFAKKIGITREHLTQVINGMCPISDRLEVLVKKHTKGSVTKGEILRHATRMHIENTPGP